MSTRRQSLEDRAFACSLFVARKGAQVRFFSRPSPFHRRGAVYTAASEVLAAAWVDGVAYGRGGAVGALGTFQPAVLPGIDPPVGQQTWIDTATGDPTGVFDRSAEPDEPTLFDVTP